MLPPPATVLEAGPPVQGSFTGFVADVDPAWVEVVGLEGAETSSINFAMQENVADTRSVTGLVARSAA